QNKEIIDSISYSKRIQSTILPPRKLVKSYLYDSFILYKPKDIVAGDFYWLDHKENKTLFAVCDCTGHGVPGAMVSVICNNGLNRSVRDHGLTDPGLILDKTRAIVVQEFEKSEEDVKDGMDIALVTLEEQKSAKEEMTVKLQYAGANNPLWVIRKGYEHVEEIKANKQPIGKFEHPLPYQTHELMLKKGDTLYIFSDGYADQFGGEKEKKFKTPNLKKLLLSIQGMPMNEQETYINNVFEKWKGNLEQIDDVCMVGIRI
ncbi:MAG: SpoIIE family protein phosphatase, partial [Crocinitomicaceae bacterium]